MCALDLLLFDCGVRPMTSRWKDRMDRLGRANEEARRENLRSLTLNDAARVMEGLLSQPLAKASHKADHPVSLSHRMRASAAPEGELRRRERPRHV